MRRILSVLVLLGILGSICSEAYAWKPRLLKKMTKPPVIQKDKKG
jgi:hypothetical protein